MFGLWSEPKNPAGQRAAALVSAFVKPRQDEHPPRRARHRPAGSLSPRGLVIAPRASRTPYFRPGYFSGACLLRAARRQPPPFFPPGVFAGAGTDGGTPGRTGGRRRIAPRCPTCPSLEARRRAPSPGASVLPPRPDRHNPAPGRLTLGTRCQRRPLLCPLPSGPEPSGTPGPGPPGATGGFPLRARGGGGSDEELLQRQTPRRRGGLGACSLASPAPDANEASEAAGVSKRCDGPEACWLAPILAVFTPKPQRGSGKGQPALASASWRRCRRGDARPRRSSALRPAAWPLCLRAPNPSAPSQLTRN